MQLRGDVVRLEGAHEVGREGRMHELLKTTRALGRFAASTAGTRG
jgi:hypothetical protein